MWQFIRHYTNYLLIGFVLTFIVYLFIRFDSDKVILGVVIGIGGGLILATALFWLERRFPDSPIE